MQGVGALLLGLPLGPCKSLGIVIEPTRTLRTFVYTLGGCSKHCRKDGTLIVLCSMHLAASSLLADKSLLEASRVRSRGRIGVEV